jgi:hypothetical protein
VKFAEKQAHPWVCDMSRGDKPCRWVLPNSDGFLCCTWREGHPTTIPHEIVSDQIFENPQDLWVYRPDLSIFNTPLPKSVRVRERRGFFQRLFAWAERVTRPEGQ